MDLVSNEQGGFVDNERGNLDHLDELDSVDAPRAIRVKEIQHLC